MHQCVEFETRLVCRTRVHCGIWQAMREATKGIAEEKEIKPKINERAARKRQTPHEGELYSRNWPCSSIFYQSARFNTGLIPESDNHLSSQWCVTSFNAHRMYIYFLVKLMKLCERNWNNSCTILYNFELILDIKRNLIFFDCLYI